MTHGSDQTFDSDFCNICSTVKMFFGSDLGQIQKTENLFLITFCLAFYFKKIAAHDTLPYTALLPENILFCQKVEMLAKHKNPQVDI